VTDILEKARTELKALVDQERAIQARRVQLQEFLKVAESLSGGASEDVRGSGQIPLPVATHGSKEQSIVETARTILAKSAPQHTRAILAELERVGIHVTGKDASQQVINLSSLLSRKKDLFVSSRAQGWSLAAPKAETPVSAPTLTGAKSNGAFGGATHAEG
jgi:hypothetical protein